MANAITRPEADGGTDGDRAATPPAPRRRGRDALVVAAGLFVGIGVSFLADDAIDLFRSGDGRPAGIATPALDEGFDDIVPAGSSAPVAPTPAATPSEAVEQFLAAEVGRDHVQSFTLLSAAGRRTYGSPTAWRAAHASIFPVIDFRLGGVNDAGERTEVVTEVRYESTIDEVIGLVPARAEVSWPVVEEDSGWLVDFDGAEITPRYPPDADAVEAARQWATARHRCVQAEEYSAGLVGLATLADRLCGSERRPALGPVAPLDSGDTSALVSAFGAPAASWARTVTIRGPVDMTVVLAPVADRWLVVGVLATR